MLAHHREALSLPFVIALASPETKAAHAAMLAATDRAKAANRALYRTPGQKRRTQERASALDITPNAALDAAEEEMMATTKARNAAEREFEAHVRADDKLSAAAVTKAREAAEAKRAKALAAIAAAEAEIEALDEFESVRKPDLRSIAERQTAAFLDSRS